MFTQYKNIFYLSGYQILWNLAHFRLQSEQQASDVQQQHRQDGKRQEHERGRATERTEPLHNVGSDGDDVSHNDVFEAQRRWALVLWKYQVVFYT